MQSSVVSCLLLQVYDVGYVLLIRKKKRKKKSTPSPMEDTENATIISKGTGFYPSYFHSFFMFLLLRLSHWWGVAYVRRGTGAAGTVSLNKLSNVGILESRSLSDTTTNVVFQLTFTASLRVYSRSCVAFSVGVIGYPHSARSFYML